MPVIEFARSDNVSGSCQRLCAIGSHVALAQTAVDCEILTTALNVSKEYLTLKSKTYVM